MKANSSKSGQPKRIAILHRTCIVCGKKFTSTRRHAELCSAACRQKKRRDPEKYFENGS